MSDWQTVRKWKERLKMISLLPFSNSALKYFPPEFTFRDPVMSLVQKYRNQGQPCALILFYLEGLNHLLSNYPPAYIEHIQSNIKRIIKEVLPQHIEEKTIIGVKQFRSDDFCAFIKGSKSLSYDYLQRLSSNIHRSIKEQLNESPELHLNGGMQLGFACYLIGEEQPDTKAAVQNAYLYSHSIAAKKLPEHFSSSRQELLSILIDEDISVLAQPIMNLRSGDIFGWEILTRGPKNTPFHSPVELFEFAHQADVLSKLEFLAIKKALEEISIRKISEQVFINITSISMNIPLFLERLLEQMNYYPGLRPSQIIFEITESHSIRDYPQMGRIIKKFRAHGFRFAVDDAGAGYSSLQTISELIPDMIKIDRSLIQNIDRISVKQSLLKALLYFAENINCQVIAEGVETEEEAEVLYQHDVQMGQGYYFAKPEPLLFDYERGHFEEMKNKIKLRVEASSALA